MPELFSGDYSFVQSEYYKACAVGRSDGDGGGFIGKLNQDTEMIMCCNENHHIRGLGSIPIVMEGVGTFAEYGRFNDPEGWTGGLDCGGAYYGMCSKVRTFISNI